MVSFLDDLLESERRVEGGISNPQTRREYAQNQRVVETVREDPRYVPGRSIIQPITQIDGVDVVVEPVNRPRDGSRVFTTRRAPRPVVEIVREYTPSRTEAVTVPLPSVVDEKEMDGGDYAVDDYINDGMEMLEAGVIMPGIGGIATGAARGIGAGLGWIWRNGLPLWMGWEASNLWRDWTAPGAGYGNIGGGGEMVSGADQYPMGGGAQNTQIAATSGDISSNDIPFAFIIRILTDVLARFGVSFA